MNQVIPAGFELKEKVQALQDALTAKHPAMPTLLREIHTALRKQPENVTLMTEEEIAVIVAGLQKQTGFELAVAATKKTGTSLKSKIAQLGEDAF